MDTLEASIIMNISQSDDTHHTKLLLLSAETRKYWTIESMTFVSDISKANDVEQLNLDLDHRNIVIREALIEAAGTQTSFELIIQFYVIVPCDTCV